MKLGRVVGITDRWRLSAFRDSAPRHYVLLAGLLSVDAALIGGDILHRHGLLDDARFSVSMDFGFGELFEYGKLTAAAAALVWSAFRWRSWAVLFWAGLFAYLVLDNAFRVHEQVGAVLGRLLSLPQVGSVRPVDFGGVIYFGVLGGVVALCVAAILRSASSHIRHLTLTLGAGLLVLAFFGVAVDFVHQLVSRHWRRWVEPTAAVIEDGGELVVISGLLWMVWRMRDPHMGGEPSSRARVLGAPRT